MPLFNVTDRRFACAISKLTNCNPFLPERMELEREALGKQFDDSGPVWSRQSESDDRRANIERLENRVEQLTEQAYHSLVAGESADNDDLALYEDLVCYLLYYRYFGDRSEIDQLLGDESQSALTLDSWKPFAKDFERYLKLSGRSLPSDHGREHLFAGFFQVRRPLSGDDPGGRSVNRFAVYRQPLAHAEEQFLRRLGNGAVCLRADVEQQGAVCADAGDQVVDQTGDRCARGEPGTGSVRCLIPSQRSHGRCRRRRVRLRA